MPELKGPQILSRGYWGLKAKQNNAYCMVQAPVIGRSVARLAGRFKGDRAGFSVPGRQHTGFFARYYHNKMSRDAFGVR